jgi:DNA-binding transcriptional MocR family regulator
MLENITLTSGDEPIYRQLADAIAERIASGELAGGDRLPPQRRIAQALHINLTTVTRAFSALQRRGLVASRPGRGTIVVPAHANEAASFKSAPVEGSGFVDLSVNRPATPAYLEVLATILPRLSKDRRYPALQDYHPAEGPAWARAAAAAWLAPVAGDGSAARVVLADGAQHGLACVLAGIARPGNVVLADAVTYQGINALCRSLGLELRGVSADRAGMLPDALEAACSRWQPRALFLVPSLHNPTTVTLSEARRSAIAEVARRHNLLIIEDDVYGPLLDVRPPSFAVLEPELTIHVSGLSKCVAPGLRLGFVVAPRALVSDVASALRVNCWSPNPLAALIGTVLLEDGIVKDLIERQKQELRLRQAMVSEILVGLDVQTHDTSTHAWLSLPEPWRGNAFARVCHKNGVGVLAAEAFTIGREASPHAVRINVAAARSRGDLQRALQILADLARTGHLHLHDMV